MSKRPIRTFLAAAAALVVVLGVYTAYWNFAAQKLRHGIDGWVEQRRAVGWQVEIGEIDITGFPFRHELFLKTPRISGAGNTWRWMAPNVLASGVPWQPGKFSVMSPGIHIIGLPAGEVWAEFEGADADLYLARRGAAEVVVRLSDMNLRLPDNATIQTESIVIRVRETAQLPRTGIGDGEGKENDVVDSGHGIAADLRNINLPSQWRPALGRAMQRLSLDALVLGPLAPAVNLRERLIRWRDSGGTAEINALAVDWGALRLRSRGTFALDRNLQPEGAMSAEIQGGDAVADRLVAAGVLDAKAAFAAKLANRALALGSGPARVPLSVQDQRLFLGPAPILRLKPVVWD